MVAEGVHCGEAACCGAAGGVRGAHVSRDDAEDVAEGHFEFDLLLNFSFFFVFFSVVELLVKKKRHFVVFWFFIYIYIYIPSHLSDPTHSTHLNPHETKYGSQSDVPNHTSC